MSHCQNTCDEEALRPISKVTPRGLQFADTNVTELSAGQTVEVKNVGWTDLIINEVEILGDFSVVRNCPNLLKPQEVGTFIVKSAPLSNGLKLGKLSIHFEHETKEIVLTGTGIGGAGFEDYLTGATGGLEVDDDRVVSLAPIGAGKLLANITNASARPVPVDIEDILPVPASIPPGTLLANVNDDDAPAVAVPIEDILPDVSEAITIPRYPGMNGLIPWPWAGIAIGQAAPGVITDNPSREVKLEWFYTSDTSTDMDALRLYRDNIGLYGDCVLSFPRTGRGPSGRFIIDDLIWFQAHLRLVMDFGVATIRYTTAQAGFKFSGGDGPTSSSTPWVDFFVMKNGVHQVAAAVQRIGEWDMVYRSSRVNGTGYVENMRVVPQDFNNTGHSVDDVFVTRNTWYFQIKGGSYTPRLLANNSLIRQEGACIVTTIDEATECSGFHRVIKWGFALMVGAEMTFTTGGYSRNRLIRQGSNIAKFARNDGAYGYTFSLWNEVGTLVPGTAELLDLTGAVVGSVNITTIGRYYQPSEALQVKGASTWVNTNWFLKETARVNPDGSGQPKILNVGFHDFHIAYREGFLDIDGITDLQVGTGSFLIALQGNKQCININHGEMIAIDRNNITTNALGGRFFRGRNINVGSLTMNKTFFVEQLWDLDNTVKSFTVAFNQPIENVGTVFSNICTGHLHNGSNPRGIKFLSNGAAGIGFDQDNCNKRSWSPTISSSVGAVGAVTMTPGSFYIMGNGRLTLGLKANITNRGTADGIMYISLPPEIPDDIFNPQSYFTGVIGNTPAIFFVDWPNKRLFCPNAAITNDIVQSAWKLNNGYISTPIGVWINGTIGFEHDMAVIA